jgi:hypothetical protein
MDKIEKFKEHFNETTFFKGFVKTKNEIVLGDDYVKFVYNAKIGSVDVYLKTDTSTFKQIFKTPDFCPITYNRGGAKTVEDALTLYRIITGHDYKKV